MPICSYLIITRPGESRAVARRLERLSPCDLVRATNRDVLLLVTDTETPGDDEALRETLGSLPGVEALVLTFGDLDARTATPASGRGPESGA